MPDFKKLTADDLASKHSPVSGERAKIREEYEGYLKDLEVGEGGELSFDDEKKVTVKNRLKRAATELGMTVEFKRSGSNAVRFSVTSVE